MILFINQGIEYKSKEIFMPYRSSGENTFIVHFPAYSKPM